MRRIRAWVLRLAGLLNRQRRERELVDELESHLQLHMEDNLRAGMTPVEARRQALIKLGGVEQTKEIYRDRRGIPLVESFIQDVRYGLRMLAKSPGFTAIALLTLALGIGGTTAIFSVIYGVLIAPFPYRDSHRLAVLDAQNTAEGGRYFAKVSADEWLDYQEQNHVFDEVIGGTLEEVRLTGSGTAEVYWGPQVTANTFRALGVLPLLGRAFTDEDGRSDAPPVVVLSYEVWQSKFGRDPGIIGKTLVLNQQPTTVIGVMQPRECPGDLLRPTTISRAEGPGNKRHFLEGRLKPGVSFKQATADIALLAQRFAKVYPNDHPKDVTFTVHSFALAFTGHLRYTWGILLGAVGLLLLIACVNVTNLLLARATGRQREFAIRASLGASNIRLIRQLMVESLLLALGGTVLGCAFAQAALTGLLAIVPERYLDGAVVRINGPVFLFSIGTALLCALLFGMAPALRAARADLQEPLKASSRGAGESRGHGRLRRLLVVSEVALSMVLLTGGGLLIRSFFALRYADLGYNLDNLLEGGFQLPEDRYKTAEQRNQFRLELMRRVRALPGVTSAALTFPGLWFSRLTPIEIDGKPSAEHRSASLRFSDDRFFETMGIQLLQGRTISEDDMVHARKVAVISRALVTKYFGGEGPLGRQIRVPLEMITRWPPPSFQQAQQAWFEIVGVVADTRHSDETETAVQPMMWFPYTTAGELTLQVFIVRTAGEPARLTNAVQRTVADMDKDLSMWGHGPLVVRESLDRNWYSEPRFVLTMLVTFASLGLVLVSIGVYGVLSYHASQRTHEIGIRMALGAQAAEVRWLVLKSGLRSLVVGIAIGVPASIALARILQNRIWGIKSADPPTLGAVALLLTAVGLAACYIPARRATKVDPMVALRFE
jgi:putative ABC transport system permease protein